MDHGDMVLFALQPSADFGQRVSAELGIPLSSHEERDFEDGEHKSRPLVSVRGKDVFVIQSLYDDNQQSVNDKLCRLLFFLGSLRDASAGRVTAVVPYLCYARKDQKTQPRDPVTTRYVATLFEAMGVDRLVTLDIHNTAAFQNAFRCRTEHLESRKLFVDYFSLRLGSDEAIVISPDVGGVKRADRFRQALGCKLGKSVPSAFMDKQRNAGVVTGGTLAGPVKDKTAIIIDDLISTGATVTGVAKACRTQEATRVYVAAPHGLFTGHAGDVLDDPSLDKIVVTDTIPPFRLDPDFVKKKLVILDSASLFAESIKSIHGG